MLKRDTLWEGGYSFYFDDELFQPSTDSFVLSAFPRLKSGERVCDLGCGSGLLGILLLRGYRPYAGGSKSIFYI